MYTKVGHPSIDLDLQVKRKKVSFAYTQRFFSKKHKEDFKSAKKSSVRILFK